MKLVFAFLVITIACLAYSEAGLVPPAEIENAIQTDDVQPCKCMSRQACGGREVNSE